MEPNAQNPIRVDIVTPNLNYGRYLQDAIDSVRASSTNNIHVRHIVIDGKSTDSSLAVLRSNPGIVWESQTDSGQSDALNRGLALTQGDVVGWLNSDEFYIRGAVKRAVEALTSTGADAVFGEFLQVDDRGRLLRRVGGHAATTLTLRTYGCHIPSCSFFAKTSFLREFGFNQTSRYWLDWDLYLRFIEAKAHIAFDPRILGAFRMHDARITAQRPTQIDIEQMYVRHRVLWNSQSKLSRTRYRLAALFGRILHLVMKAFNGAYIREIVSTASSPLAVQK